MSEQSNAIETIIFIHKELNRIDNEIKSMNKRFNLIIKGKWQEINEYKHIT